MPIVKLILPKIGTGSEVVTVPALNYAPSVSRPTAWAEIWLLWVGQGLILLAGVAHIVKGFSDPFLISDDGRQHIFWMARFLDARFFQDDLIADYFSSLVPAMVRWLYEAAAYAGLDPQVLEKLLPLPVALISGWLFFRVARRITRHPTALLFAILLFGQMLWSDDSVPSGTPRAFAYLLLAGFMDGVLSRRHWQSLLFLGLHLGLYPVLLPLTLAAYGLYLATDAGWRIRLSRDIGAWTVLIAGALMTVYLAAAPQSFGSLIDGAAAQTMHEFGDDGRLAFFHANPALRWLFGSTSGLLPGPIFRASPFMWMGFALPFLMRRRRRSEVMSSLQPDVRLLACFAVAGVAVFLLSSLALFQLYLPSRYPHYAWQIVMPLAGGVVLAHLLEQLTIRGRHRELFSSGRMPVGLAMIGAVAFIWAPSPLVTEFPRSVYARGGDPALYAFLKRQPDDIVAAGIAEEMDNIPAFTARSVLTSREASIPLVPAYYDRLRERTSDLAAALYATDPAVVAAFIGKYRVTHFFLEAGTYAPGYLTPKKKDWVRSVGWTEARVAELGHGAFVMAALAEACTAAVTNLGRVVDAKCLRDAALHPTDSQSIWSRVPR